MIDQSLHQVALPGSAKDLAEMYALASSGIFGSYVSYAGLQSRWFAGGVLGEIAMYRDRLTWRVGDAVHEAAPGPRPMREIGELLRTWPLRDRRAFGYLTFELAHLIHGTDLPAGRDQPLAHLVVPTVEVHWTPATTVVKSSECQLAEFAADVLRSENALPATRAVRVDLVSPQSRKRYESMVRDVVSAIKDGRLHKAIVSRRLDLPFTVDLPASYVLGSALNTPARSFLLDLNGRQCAGFSPETVVEVGADGSVRTQPLAGTRPLLKDSERDRVLHEELRWDVKECYEHVISARLAHEEMLSVCEPASVAVRDLLTVKPRGTVQHLASMVTGQLTEGLGAWEAVEALWPAVTASGIPKRPALRIIGAAEGEERGLYAGAVCVADGNGSLDAALVLRSIFQEYDRTWLQAGAGIVADSDPAREYDETTSKLRSAAGCLVAGEPGRARGSVPAAGPISSSCQR